MKTGITALLLAVVGLSGCSTPSVHARSMGGTRGFVINCSGLTTRWDACYTKAEDMCPAHGYRVISKTSDIKEDPADSFLGFSPGRDSRTLVIACKPPPGV